MPLHQILMTPEEVIKRCDENTIGVVPTLGVTFTGQFEPVKAVAGALDQLEKDEGLDIPIHVDGASGGFLAPFCGKMDRGIPALCWKLQEGADPGFSLYDLADRLRYRRWQVPAYSLPAHLSDVDVQRILVRHGVSRDLGSLLLADMKRAITYFQQHPVHARMTAAEASGFHP
jgi:glutamate/tyrosine decarboxylase-like PLP-dependent enzyme